MDWVWGGTKDLFTSRTITITITDDDVYCQHNSEHLESDEFWLTVNVFITHQQMGQQEDLKVFKLLINIFK